MTSARIRFWSDLAITLAFWIMALYAYAVMDHTLFAAFLLLFVAGTLGKVAARS